MEISTFSIITTGCRANQYDSDRLYSIFTQNNLHEEEDPRRADLIVVNACCVTHKAERDARRIVNSLLRTKTTRSKIILTGCFSRLRKLDRVDFSGELEDILRYTELRFPSSVPAIAKRRRPYVKIQDGCNFACSFCIVSRIRGTAVSKSIEEIERDIYILIGKGFREVVLTGIQIGNWGKEWGKELFDLLVFISKIKGDFRIRLSSILPNYITEELVSLFTESPERFAPHFHIPLQSGSGKILKDMKRPYRIEDYIEKIKLVSNIPKVSIGTDIIAGFPTETDKDFSETVNLIKSIPFSYMHIFEYSKREGTPASYLRDIVDSRERKRRVKILLGIAKQKRECFKRSQIGTLLYVIPERRTGSYIIGTSENYLKIKVKFKKDGLPPILRVRAEDISGDYLVGKVV